MKSPALRISLVLVLALVIVWIAAGVSPVVSISAGLLLASLLVLILGEA